LPRSGPARRRLGLLALAGAAGLPACARQVRVDAPPRPNLLLVTVARMDPRAFDAAWRAELETPALDALCASGVAFANASASSIGTDAELATVFTGLHPRSHGSYASIYDLGEELDTLAEIARSAGYRTGGFTVLTPCSDFPGFRQGFDAFAAPPMAESWGERRPNGEVLAGALAWLRACEKDRNAPWFCWIHLGLPAIESQSELTGAQERSLPEDLDSGVARGLLENPLMGFEEVRQVFALRRRLELVALDEDLGELLAFVREHGAGGERAAAGDVAVAVTALRGDDHEITLFVPLQGLRVPLLFANSDGAEARIDAQDATLADVLPTLLARAGLAPRHGSPVDGIDLLAARLAVPRLAVIDRVELGKPTETFVGLDGVIVWESGGSEGDSFVDGDPMMLPAPRAKTDAALAAYRDWARGRPDADAARRFDLEREFWTEAEAWMREHRPEVLPDDR
jgi:arylsulfatase A-like enzyme